MTAEALSAPFPGSLRRYQRLLSGYLRPEWPRLALLTLVLAGAIAAQVVAPLLASRFIDNASSGAALRQLAVLSLLAIGVALAGRVLAVAETYVAEQLSWAATNAMRADLLAHLLRLDASFHADHTPGELIERVDGDVSTLARFFSRFLVYVVGNAVLMLGVLGLLVHVDWRIGLALSAFVLLALGVMLRIHVVASRSWAAERQASADFYGFLGEYLAGLEDVRASGAVPFVFRRCAEVMRSWLAVLIRAEMWGYLMVATSWGTFGLATAVALGLCALRYREGTLTIGTVYLVFQYATVLRQPTDQIRHEMQDLQLADASMRRVEALMRTQPRLVDGPAIALPPGRLSLDLDHVWFEYAPGVSVLRDVTVRVETGRVLGIVGRTGSGKTTLTRLLPRFDDPASGAVRLGGVDVRAVRLAALRERLGLVTQEVHLFNASVRDNLTLFDDEVPEERVHAVLAGLGLGDWLASLPRGLETVLGPGGAGVSAGQAQVLACARIFLRDPDVVILDEASSRLDPATERLVHDALGRLVEGRTALIVAHRLSTLAYADEILVLEDGRVREHGPRLALAADPTSRYAGLLRLAAEEVMP